MDDLKLKITEYMEENGISYTELAKRIGTSRQNVFSILNSSSPLSSKSAEKMSKALGLTIETRLV